MSDDKKNIAVTSYNQSGGITAHTVKVEKGQRTLNADLKSALLANVPRNKPVKVFRMNADSESLMFANEIHAFLKNNSFNVEGDEAMPHMFFNVKPGNVNVGPDNSGKEVWITIGAYS